ncbi:hypothetical protein [Dyella flagellata]|uniref:Antitoxin Xre/MbcA/ParS-like toxin-binding domain-containing protein n=1 Tax=Dyella flagellata TaxID=1867833 RepID=A0ABQ5X9C7_9GAMM|nr:hypothetical protein [Dyella flagellata]GLQ87259.1 hypothetical protein GCM10007898_08250 [Dyella flagellata]
MDNLTLPAETILQLLQQLKEVTKKVQKATHSLRKPLLRAATGHDLAPIKLERDAFNEVRRLRQFLEEVEAADHPQLLENMHAVAKAQARSEADKQELVASGQVLPANAFAKKAGISRQAVNKGKQNGSYFALKPKGRELYYPIFLADSELRELGLDEALKILKDETSWSKWLFFTNRRGSLGNKTPLEALHDRAKEQVLNAARAYRDR